ncbi:DNA-binding response regulator [Bradyrhizobium sp. AC87j1]|nr:DNA-binding response regulator [Bradyrhizobium sp. AC87j1]
MSARAPENSDPLLPSPLLLVEDEPVMHARLKSILMDLGYAEEALRFAVSIADAHTCLADQPFAMVLIDVGLPDGNGIDLIRDLHGQDGALPILVISAWSHEHVILEALQAGATGYLLKERDDIEISLSIRSTLRGGAPIDPFVAKRILGMINPAVHAPSRPATAKRPILTAREVEILGFVAKGLTNQEIASALTLSRLTVECHIKNVYKKLAVGSRTEAVYEARMHGLLA